MSEVFEDLGYRGADYQGPGGDSDTKPTTRRRSSSRGVAVAPSALIPTRWLCHATRECRAAGPLETRRCPRGDWHHTHTAHYVDLAA